MRWIKYLALAAFIVQAAQIDLNFKNLEIQDFIKMVAKITHKNILVTANIRGKVDFISVKPLDEDEIYDILLNVLKSKGYTLVEDNGFLKVVRNVDALKEAPPLEEYNKINQMETAIIALSNLPANVIYNQVQYMRSKFGKLVVNKENNLIIATDYPRNIEMLRAVIRKLDTYRPQQLRFISLQYSDTQKVYPKLVQIATSLFDQNAKKYKLIRNDEANSIIIVGPKDVVAKLEQVVNELDAPPKPVNLKTEVIRLNNSDVMNISKVLQQVINVKYKKDKPSLTADKETNSLIILANTEQILTLKKIIQALDVPKQQVYVQAKILEISNNKVSEIGAKLGLLAGSANSSGLYTLSANLGGPAIVPDITTLNLDLPTLREGLALGALIDLLERYGAAKKLSEPSILCINNTASTIYVGKTVSVKTGQTTANSTSVSYKRQDVGLTLKIKPRIDADNKVSLTVETIVEDILPGAPDLTLPITSKRKINTTTIVNNGQSIIIGGLVKDNLDVTKNKVPLLGDIPLLGQLFQHTSTTKDKTTLVILLTPYIVKKSSDLNKLRLTLAKLNALEKKFAEDLAKKSKNENSNKYQPAIGPIR